MECWIIELKFFKKRKIKSLQLQFMDIYFFKLNKNKFSKKLITCVLQMDTT